jgi:signal transduction histidine kinase
MIASNDIHWGLVNILINNLPSFLLVYYPFRKNLKIKGRWAVAINAVIFLTFIGTYYFLAPHYLSFSFLQAYKLTQIVPSVIAALYIIDDRKPKIIYFTVIMITYLTVAAKTGNFIAVTLFETPGYSQQAVINFAVFAVSLPLMLLYLNRVFEKTVHIVESASIRIWKIIWVIPMLFLIISLLSNMRFDPDVIANPEFIIINGIIVSGIFISMTILVRALQISNEAADAKREAEELAERNVLLDSLNQMKTEFLQDMSHEMRNPLTTIIRCVGHADSRLDMPDSKEAAHEVLKIAEDEAMRLGRMVTSMVNLAAMSGSAESREKINFAEMLNNCAEMFRLQLDNRDNALRVDISPGLPYVYGVADRLKQVLVNLFTNAAKYTKNGEVTLEAFNENDYITVRVSDTGEGIPPSLIPRIFERGVSGDKDSPGFGLPICQTIVEAHGGEIHIESEPDKGTTVIFTIPVYGGQSEVRKHE